MDDGSLAISACSQAEDPYWFPEKGDASFSTTTGTYPDDTSSEGVSSVDFYDLPRTTPASPSLEGCDIVDGYLSRRDRRLEQLKAGRRQRMQATNNPTPLPTCMEEHPYYLEQQQQRLVAIKQSLPESQEQTNSSELPESTVESMRDELIAAYQLIHRQRVRIQQLEKQQEGIWLTDAEIPSDPKTLIRQLQSQNIQLQHSRAYGEFHLRNRITQDALRYHERLSLHKTRAQYWQSRFDNAQQELDPPTSKEASLTIDTASTTTRNAATVTPTSTTPVETPRRRFTWNTPTAEERPTQPSSRGSSFLSFFSPTEERKDINLAPLGE